MADALNGFTLLATPQSEQADPSQVQNQAGGFTFTVDEMQRLRRFLVLGTDGGTYYTGEREHTQQNAKFVVDIAKRRGVEVVDEIVAISDGGRAPKNNQALFALAVVTVVGDEDARKAAYVALPKVARIGTHLFQFIRYRQQLTGWSAGLRRAVGRWYTERTPEQAAFQIAKYGSREGWTHRDVLRQAHVKPPTPKHDAVFKWAVGGAEFKWAVGGAERADLVPEIIKGVDLAKMATSPTATALIVRKYGLTWEMLPTEHLNEKVVWEALLEGDKVGITALIRQLPRLTKIGLLDDREWRKIVTARLTSKDLLRKGRVHPINVLVALRTYGSGQSERGSGVWTPVSQIVDALDAAFYAAFDTVVPTGKRRLIALDVSGSMASARVNGLPLTAREASAAMAMVTLATEDDVHVVGFTGGGYGWGRQFDSNVENLTVLDLSARRRLDDNVRSVSNLPFGGTDCSLPMLYALEKGLQFDSFEILTDSETWAGAVHPHEALERYRRETGINARLVVAGTSATDFTIADPKDPLMLDVVGMDSSVPNLINDFIRGDI